MRRHSAGLLAYHREDGLQVFLAHPGGPFFARKDAGAWSVPKGEFDPATEDPWVAARREFAEEIGVPAPPGPGLDLGAATLKSGKVVRAYAVQAPGRLAFVISNTFELAWPTGHPPRSYPEVDRARWFSMAEAKLRINPGQVILLDRLVAELG